VSSFLISAHPGCPGKWFIKWLLQLLSWSSSSTSVIFNQQTIYVELFTSLVHKSHHWFIFFANDLPPNTNVKTLLLTAAAYFIHGTLGSVTQNQTLFCVCLLGWKGRLIYACLCVIIFGFDLFFLLSSACACCAVQDHLLMRPHRTTLFIAELLSFILLIKYCCCSYMYRVLLVCLASML